MPKIAAGATNKNISLAPNGTGKVVVGTGAADATVQSDGDHNLILQTGNSTTSKIEINDGANGDVAITPNGTGNLTIDNIAISDNTIKSTDPNGNIDITPDGTGEVNISKVDIDSGAIDGTTIATSDVTVGSGKTLDVSAGTLTSSTAQKQAIVDGADIEGEDILSTGETGTFLGADGDDSSSWQSISGTLPSQTGNAEKILKTSGSAASWTATRKLIASTDGIQRSDATAVLSEDGSNVATLDNVSLGSSVISETGIYLGVSSAVAANLLDYYEEGTWDAVVTDGTNPMTMNGNYDTGYYTKVGNLVTVSGIIGTTSLGSASGSIRITGLPFPIANNNAAYFSAVAGYGAGFAITGGYSVGYYGAINDDAIYLQVWGITTGVAAMQAAQWTDNGEIILGFSYRAA